MSNLVIQPTPKSFLQQFPLSTGQVTSDEEGIVVGNSGDLQTGLYESALNTKIGYYKAAEIAQKAHKEGTTLKEMAVKLGYLDEKSADLAQAEIESLTQQS